MRLGGRGNREEWCAALLTALLLVIFFLRAPLTGSLWLDETISAWLVNGSAADAIRRVTVYQGQSPFYYLLLWGLSSPDSSEAALRCISVVCGLLSLVLVFRLAERLSGRRTTGYVAIGLVLCASTFQDAILSARPYALGFLCATASLFFLERLTKSFTRRDAFLFAVSCVATWYSHYLFAVIFIGHIWTILRSQGLFRQLVPWSLIGLVSVVPTVPQVAHLFGRREGLMFAPSPGLLSFVNGAIPIPVVVIALVGIALGMVWGARGSNDSRLRDAFAFLLPYIVVPVAVFAVWSLSGSHSMWVTRYWVWQVGVWAVLLACCVSEMCGAPGRTITLLAVATFAILRVSTQIRHLEEWREAAQRVHASRGSIALYSGLIEVESGSGAHETEFEEYIRAPLTTYGVTAPVSVLSMSHLSEDVERLPANTEYLVIFNRRVGDGTSKGEVEQAISDAGVSVEQLPGSSLVLVYKVTPSKTD